MQWYGIISKMENEKLRLDMGPLMLELTKINKGGGLSKVRVEKNRKN